jgi:FKBP-type peptidyl-prolyl cis-trans isomerase
LYCKPEGVTAAYFGTKKFVDAARPAAAILADNATKAGVIVTPSGLQYKVLVPGTGRQRPTVNDIVAITYEGRFANGDVFDSTDRHGGPVQVPVGGFIPGFSEALTLMPVGSKYRVWIPPALGYPQGNGPIPPNSLLIFDIGMLAIAPRGAAPAGMRP